MKDNPKAVKAFIAAHEEGVLKTHFVVFDMKHFDDLIKDKKIKLTSKGWMKVSTKKPIWFYQEG